MCTDRHTRSPMHDCTAPVMTTNELSLNFTFGSSSINGVLGKGGKGVVAEEGISPSLLAHLMAEDRARNHHAETGPTWGRLLFVICTASASMFPGYSPHHIDGAVEPSVCLRGLPPPSLSLSPSLHYLDQSVPGALAPFSMPSPGLTAFSFLTFLSGRSTCGIKWGHNLFFRHRFLVCMSVF